MPRLFGSPSDVSRIRKLQVGVEPRLAMIVGDKSTLTTIETTLRDRFNSLFGRTNIFQDDDTNVLLDNYDVVAIMPSVTDGNSLVTGLGTKDLPIISFKGSFSDDVLLLSTTNGTSASETTTNIIVTTHQIVRSQTVGTNTIYSSASAVDFLGTKAGGAVTLARDVTTATELHLLEIAEGDALTGGIDSPEARVHFGYKTLNVLSSTGLELLDASLEFLIWQSRISADTEVDVEEILSNLVEFGISGKTLPLGEPIGTAFFADTSVTASGDGTTWGTAVKTIVEMNALMTDNNGDYGFVAANTSSYNENAGVNGITITAAGSHWIGMGGNLCKVVNSNVAAVSIWNINDDNVEICGFYSNESTNSVECMITNSSAFSCYIHHNFFNGGMENGIHIIDSTNNWIYNNDIISCTNDGIELSGTSGSNRIFNNTIEGIGDDGINLNGDAVDQCICCDNKISGRAGTTDYAIQILLGDNNIISGNTMGELGTWPINDTGSNNAWVNNHADMADSAFARVNADAVAEDTADFTNIDLWTSGLFEVTMDMSNASDGTLWTLRLYEKIDESTFEEVDFDTYLVGTDTINARVRGSFEGGDSKLQVSHQSSTAVAASRTIDLKVRCIGQ